MKGHLVILTIAALAVSPLVWPANVDRSPASLWYTGALVSPLNSRLFRPSAALSVRPLDNGGLFILGEPIRLDVSPAPSWVRYRLTDAYGAAFWTVNGEVFEADGLVQPYGNNRAWLILPTDRLTRYGFYRLDVYTDQGNYTERYIGLVDPILPLGPFNSSPIGFILEIDPYQEFAAQVGHLGIKWVHFDIPLTTNDASSVLAALNSTTQDFVDQALAHDVTPIFKLIGGPPPGVSNPNSTFYQNLRQVAQSYKYKVHHWIVGNEIDGCGWWSSCDMEQYVTFLRNVAQTVRSEDPLARILAADLYQGDSQVLRLMLQEEQNDPNFTLFDVLSVHYLEEGNGEALSPDGCCGSIGTYRQVMQGYGLTKPIWNTEALSPLRGGLHWPSNEESYFRGGDAFPLLSPAKTVVGNLAVGAEKIFFFSYNYDQTLLEGPVLTRVLTERALAVRALADQLQTATYYARLGGTPSYVEAHLFKNGAETVLVIWSNESNREVQVALSNVDRPPTLFDPLGNAYPLQAVNGQYKFRVHFEPQYVRGFTTIPTLSFGGSENDAPYFTSLPLTEAVVGRPYFYNADAYDPDPTGQPNALIPVSFSLQQGPAGMSVDGFSGLLTWTPSQAGQYTVRLRVRDGSGAWSDQAFTLNVVGATENAPPQITSRPRTLFGAVGQPFGYNLNATDPNGDTLTYTLIEGPPWLSLQAATGFLRGTPTAEGEYAVTVRVSDGRGGWAEQSFTLVVAPGELVLPSQWVHLPLVFR